MNGDQNGWGSGILTEIQGKQRIVRGEQEEETDSAAEEEPKGDIPSERRVESLSVQNCEKRESLEWG